MTTLGNQITKNVIDAMNTSENPKVDKEEETKKHTYCSRAKDGKDDDDEEHIRRRHQKIRINSCRDKSQLQEKRKIREK